MKRIVAIDYGGKRCGIAATDPMQILVSPVETVDTDELMDFLLMYSKQEPIEKVVIGLPTHKDGTLTYLYEPIKELKEKIEKTLGIEVDYEDESYTSTEAKDIILKMGIKKKKRRDKTLVDKISAVLILQRYLGHI